MCGEARPPCWVGRRRLVAPVQRPGAMTAHSGWFACACAGRCWHQSAFQSSKVCYHPYAVIKAGGKQYRVSAGQKLKVEQIPADIGATITFNEVLAVGAGADVVFGAPSCGRGQSRQRSSNTARATKCASSDASSQTLSQSGGHRQATLEVFFSAIYGANGAELARLTRLQSRRGGTGRHNRCRQARKARRQRQPELIEGIGPKIAGLLKAAGVTTFEALSTTPVEGKRPRCRVASSTSPNRETGRSRQRLQLARVTGAFDALVGGVREVTGVSHGTQQERQGGSNPQRSAIPSRNVWASSPTAAS